MSQVSFLEAEYGHCYEQLRFYDTRQEALLKYLVTLTSAVATAQFALFKAFGAVTPDFYWAQIFMSVVVFVASLLLYLMMLQNRLYFVFTARQLNAIRGYMLRTSAEGGFTNNQLYTSTNFSAFKWSSVHTLQLICASLISSMFAAGSLFGFLRVSGSPSALGISALLLIVVAAAELFGGAAYLVAASKKSADDAVHPGASLKAASASQQAPPPAALPPN